MKSGTTDDYGINVVENLVHVHDFHATILHLLGLDHTRLTYRHGGRDFRLTVSMGAWSRKSSLDGLPTRWISTCRLGLADRTYYRRVH